MKPEHVNGELIKNLEKTLEKAKSEGVMFFRFSNKHGEVCAAVRVGALTGQPDMDKELPVGFSACNPRDRNDAGFPRRFRSLWGKVLAYKRLMRGWKQNGTKERAPFLMPINRYDEGAWGMLPFNGLDEAARKIRQHVYESVRDYLISANAKTITEDLRCRPVHLGFRGYHGKDDKCEFRNWFMPLVARLEESERIKKYREEDRAKAEQRDELGEDRV